MHTKKVFFVGPDDNEGSPRIDFSRAENRHYDWLSVGEMLEGSKAPDKTFLSSVNIKVATDRPDFDCLSFNAHLLVSDQARRIFEKVAVGDCDFISMRVNGAPFHILRARKIIDVLDKVESELQYFPKDLKRVMLVRKYLFKKESIPDPSLFRIPENAIRIFVTDTIKDALQSSRLIGFQLIDFENPPPTVYVS